MINIAIIGCGHWGPNYIRNFKDIPDSDVVMCCDRDQERLENITKRFPEIKTTTKYTDILENGNIDAVIIATPASTHYEIAKACLLTGKHVLVEKPVTTDVTQAKDLADIIGKTQRILLVGHIFLYNSGIRKMKEFIDNKEIGQIYYLYSTRTNLGPIRHDVDVIWDLAPHDISIFNYWLDRQPLWVSAVGAKILKNDRYDFAFITLGYSESIFANIHISWIDPNKLRNIVIVGSHRRIVFNDLDNQEMIRIFEKGISTEEHPSDFVSFPHLTFRDGDIISPKINISEPLRNQCQHFLDCVKNGFSPLTDIKNGLEVVSILEKVSESITKNGVPVDLA